MADTLKPKDANRWGNCGGSHPLGLNFPQGEDTEKQREGTAAHFWLSEALNERFHPVGTAALNGHPLDQDMIDGGTLLLADVALERAKASSTAALKVETYLTMHGLIHEDCEGRPDVYLVDSVNHRIVLWEYKYGHRDIEVYLNKTLISYIAGIFEGYEYERSEIKGWEIDLRIVQPRSYSPGGPIKQWKALGWVIWDEIELLAAAAQVATGPNAPTETGIWCLNCPGAHACEALRKVGSYVLDISGSSNPEEPTLEALGQELSLLEAAKARLEARCTGLEEVALSKIRAGQNLPGWTIKNEAGAKKWTRPIEEIIFLGDIFGVDLKKPAATVTPTQAIKLGVDASVIDGYSTRPTTQKLVQTDGSTAAKAFGNI